MRFSLFHAFSMLCAVAIISASCSKDNNEKAPDEEDSLVITASAMNFPNTGGTNTFYVTTNTNWYAKALNGYIVKVSPSSGEAGISMAVTVTAEENPTEADRETTVTVTAGTKSQSFKVTIAGKPEEVLDPQYARDNNEFHYIAYMPDYQDISAVPDSILSKVDFVNFAFATINSTFTVSVNETALSKVNNRCKKLGVKVMLCFGGTASIYKEMVSTKANRKIFINSVMAIVDKYNLDGVDNDWEYPAESDGSGAGNVLLMQEFSNILHKPESYKYLTMAINSGKYSGKYRNAISYHPELWKTVDWFHVMTYDDFANQNYPDITDRNHSTLEFMKVSYEFYVTTTGISAKKYLGGIACYGRPSGITQSGTVLTYKRIIELGGDPDADEAMVTSSKYNDGKTEYKVFYNGRKTAKAKVDYMLEKNTGGYFFWELGQDRVDTCSLVRTSYLEMMEKTHN